MNTMSKLQLEMATLAALKSRNMSSTCARLSLRLEGIAELEEVMICAYKLLRVRRDGTLGLLFINRKQVIPVNQWLEAKPGCTDGFAFRPGWHACSKKLDPHLSKRGFVWCQVLLHDVREPYRPEAQGGLWYTAGWMRITTVLG